MFGLACLDSRKRQSVVVGCTLRYGGPILDDDVDSLDDAFEYAVRQLQYMQGSRKVKSVRFIRISAKELSDDESDRRVIGSRSEVHRKMDALNGHVQLGLFE